MEQQDNEEHPPPTAFHLQHHLIPQTTSMPQHSYSSSSRGLRCIASRAPGKPPQAPKFLFYLLAFSDESATTTTATIATPATLASHNGNHEDSHFFDGFFLLFFINLTMTPNSIPLLPIAPRNGKVCHDGQLPQS